MLEGVYEGMYKDVLSSIETCQRLVLSRLSYLASPHIGACQSVIYLTSNEVLA